MTLLLSQLRKDFTLTWPILIFWVIAIVYSTTTLLSVDPTDAPLTGSSLFATSWNFLLLLLSALLFLQEPPRNSDAFWATRPISPNAMMVSKAVFIAAMIASPLLIGQILTYVDLGLNEPSVITVAALSGTSILSMIGIGACLAVISPNIGVFVGLLVVGYPLRILLYPLADPVVAQFARHDFGFAILAGLVATLAFAGAVFCRYRGVSWWLFVPLFLIGCFAQILQGVTQGANDTSFKNTSLQATDAETRVVTAKVHPLLVEGCTPPWNEQSGDIDIPAVIEFDSELPHTSTIEGIASQLRFPDGTAIASNAHGWSIGWVSEASQYGLEASVPWKRLRLRNLVTLPKDKIARFADKRGVLTVTIDGRLGTPDRYLELPFNAGANLAVDDFRLRLHAIDFSPGGLRYEYSFLSLKFRDFARAPLLYNPQRKEILQHFGNARTSGDFRRLLLGFPSLYTEETTVSSEFVDSSEPATQDGDYRIVYVPTAQWWREARLRFKTPPGPMLPFHSTIVIENFSPRQWLIANPNRPFANTAATTPCAGKS